MHSRNALPLVLLLFASACAEVPTSPSESALDPRQPVAQREAPAPSSASSDSAPASITPAAAQQSASAASSAPAPITPAAAQQSASVTRSPASPGVGSPRLQPAEELAAPAEAKPIESARSSNSLWPRITGGFTMAPMDNDLVREWENWYASRPDYVARMIERSSHFLFHVVEQVEKRNMPMEVALLPMIESAYNPVAYSRSHASGIWQFIPSTGKDYGLRQNWWYDGRRDIIAATDAALDYLEKLHGLFGDWQLALASYNWGEGAVARAMERNRVKGLATDYESLTVPAETRGYIPKLIAVKNIISNPARYGLQIADIPNEAYFDTVTLKRHIDMKLAAKLAEMPPEEFKFLNPGHNKPVIRAGEAERIVLPRHKVVTFLANFDKHDKPMVSWQAVRLRPGEKAERVAAQHGMTLAELKQVNGLQNQRRIVAGQPLLVPLKEGSDDPQLPDMPAMPMSLPKAIQAAKAGAHSKKYVQARGTGGRAGVQKAVHKVAGHKGRKQPVRQLRADNGKRVKVVAKPAGARKAQAPAHKVKVASTR